jgi:hypothetical protein
MMNCVSQANAELEMGNQQLNFVDMDDFVDLRQLLREGESLEVFNELCVDQIVLRWANEMIRANRVQTKKTRGGAFHVHNFTDDMKVQHPIQQPFF